MPAVRPASPGPPPTPSVMTPMAGGTRAPGARIPTVIGPVQRICEGLTPVSGTEHASYDEFRGTEVSTGTVEATAEPRTKNPEQRTPNRNAEHEPMNPEP